MTRATRKFILSVVGVACLGLLVATSVSAVTFNKTMYVKFSGPVALPGVVLPAGEYVFELADVTTSRNVVRVLNRQRSKPFLQALTHRVVRHRDVKAGTLRLGEAAAGKPQPILVWYPAGETIGYQFIY